MTKNGKILVSVIVIILLVFGYFVLTNKREEKPAPVVNADIKGCYVSKLAKDAYTLEIQSQDKETVAGVLAFNNYQKDSSSGTFSGTFKDGILLGDYSFQSEGMDSVRQVAFKKTGDDFVEGFGPVTTIDNKEVFSDVSKVTYDASKNTFVRVPDCLEHFGDVGKSLSFDYNALFSANAGDGKLTTDWQSNTKQKGIVEATVAIPRSYMPKTNFSDAKLTFGFSSDPTAIANCVVKKTNEVQATPKMFRGVLYEKFTSSDAAAGNLYETTSYRWGSSLNNICSVMEYTIHSTNIANYPANQGITEFDKSAVQDELEKIILSMELPVSED